MNSLRRRAPRRGVARLASSALLALACAPAPAFASADEFDEPPRSEPEQRAAVERILDGGVHGQQPDAELVLDALLEVGPECVPALVAALAPADASASDARATEPRVTEYRRKALLRALDELPEAALRRRNDGVQDERAVEIALAVLEAIGGARDLDLLLALGAPQPGSSARSPLERRFEAALRGLLAHDPRAHARLAERFARLDPRLRWIAVRAVGGAGAREGFELFAAWLGADPTLDLAVLTQLGRLAAAAGPPADWGLQLRLRTYLGAEDEALRREAALTAGRIEDLEAIPELLLLLRDESEGVRANAHWSLCAMSGKQLSADPKRWSEWYDAEHSWWRERAPELLRSLGEAEDPGRIRVVGELSAHRLFRDELARELATLLERRDPKLARVVCSALGNLRSSRAVPALVELLRDGDEAVSHQAWLALRAITGRDLPQSYEAWFPNEPG